MKKLFCFSLAMLATYWSHAQEKSDGFNRWGLAIGLETQYMSFESLTDPVPEPEYAIYDDRNKAGIAAGIIYHKKLWRGLGFQSGISLSWVHNDIKFYPEKGRKRYDFGDLELPVYVTLTNVKRKQLPVRAKLLAGGRVGYNMLPQPDERLQLYRERFALDLGLGGEIKIGKLILTPEMIYSHGLNNLHDFKGTPSDFLIGRIQRDKLTFRLLLMPGK